MRLVAAVEATLTGANDRAGFKGERAKVDAHHWMQAVDGDQNDKADEEECLTLLQYMQQMLGGAYGYVSARAAAAADDERALNGEEVDKDEMLSNGRRSSAACSRVRSAWGGNEKRG